MSDERRRPVSWVRAALWLGAVAALLVAADLGQRLLFYRILPDDHTRPLGWLRRPVKDTAMSVLQRTVTPAPAEGIPVFDFYLKTDDRAHLRAQLMGLQRRGGNAAQLPPGWLPARLQVDGRTLDVRIRLRGEQHYHGIPPRPSLRVRVRRGQSLLGATDFNLLEPYDKTSDLLFLWEAQQLGLMGWDGPIGVLAFDGEPVAVVQFVAQVRRPLADQYGRPEGMFFKGTGRIYEEGAEPERCARVVQVVTDWARDTRTSPDFAELREYIDVERFRAFTALLELSGSRHGMLPLNLKGYCHPETLRAEFLPWDVQFGSWRDVGARSGLWQHEGTQFLRVDRYRMLHDETLYGLVVDRIEPMLARMERFNDQYGQLLSRDPLTWFPRGGESGGWMFQRDRDLPAILRGNAADIRAALEGQQLSWALDDNHHLLFWTLDRGAKIVTALRAGKREIPLEPPVPVYGRFESHQPVVALRSPPGLIDGLYCHAT